MSYKLDYAEPVGDVIQRLVGEHAEFRGKLKRIRKEIELGNLPVALDLLSILKAEVLRHAVEEEAIVAREIMRKKSAKESEESVRVLQEHRNIVHFFNNMLPKLQSGGPESAMLQLKEFLSFLEKHHEKEQMVVFPLATGSTPGGKGCRHILVSDFGSRFIVDMYGNRRKVMAQHCASCGAYLTMDGTEIPKGQIRRGLLSK